jgi:hypothetical protein
MIDYKKGTFIGLVEDNKDPLKIGRCRIRVINVFDTIPRDDLPWASPWKDLNGNSFSVPEVGKLVTVIFDQGNIYKPEYICAEHYHKNLEEKLKLLSQTSTSPDLLDDYTSMKALIFDHSTQIYVNESEGLKLDHKYNNIHIEDGTISINLKDNCNNLRLGDANANQSVILGNHFLDWFSEFLEILVHLPGFDAKARPLSIHQKMLDHKQKYDILKYPKFLSHHVWAVDNDAVKAVQNTDGSFPVKRVNFGIAGDVWSALHMVNNLTRKIKDAPRPWRKKKKKVDAKYKPPQKRRPMDGPGKPGSQVGSLTGVGTGSPKSSAPIQNVDDPFNAKPADGIGNIGSSQYTSQNLAASYIDPDRQFIAFEEEDEMSKLVRYLESKEGSSPISGKTEDYVIYEDPYVLNIVAFRNKLHEYGKVTNRFDDELWVFFKDKDNQWAPIRKYKVTTMPGYEVVDGKKLDPPVLPENIGFINYGQYVNSYKLGYHIPEDYGKRHPALICDKVGIRMNKKKGSYPTDRYVNTVVTTQLGVDIDGWTFDTGMNIHCAMAVDDSLYGNGTHPKASTVYDEVNNWSMGCIVFNDPQEYREFIGLCEEQKTKAKKSQYTLTVASYREYEIFETDEDFDSNDNVSDDLEDRFPDFEDESPY